MSNGDVHSGREELGRHRNAVETLRRSASRLFSPCRFLSDISGGCLAKQQTDIRRWALIGAEQRLVQLAEEAAAIHRAFPELRQGGGAEIGTGRRGRNLRGGVGVAGTKRKRRKMSAAARKRISEAQKARWRKQKAGK